MKAGRPGPLGASLEELRALPFWTLNENSQDAAVRTVLMECCYIVEIGKPLPTREMAELVARRLAGRGWRLSDTSRRDTFAVAKALLRTRHYHPCAFPHLEFDAYGVRCRRWWWHNWKDPAADYAKLV